MCDGIPRTAFLMAALAVAGATADGAENLVPNGGFEDGVAAWGWQQWQGREEPGHLAADNPYEGAVCYRLTWPGHGGERFINSGTFEIDPAADYQFSIALACEGLPPDAASVQILQWGTEATAEAKPQGWITVPAGSGVGLVVLTGGTHPWRTFTVDIPGESIKPSTRRFSVYVRHAAVGVGILAIDAVRLVKTQDRADLAQKPSAVAADKQTQRPRENDLQQQGNLYPGDTSFETGTAGWLACTRENGESPHGSHHLLIPADVSQARGPDIHQTILEDTPYSLSFYARTDQGALDALVDVWHLRYSIMKRVRIHATPAWQRFVIPVPPQPVDRGCYVVLTKENDGALRIDALQIERGDATPFQPTEKVSVSVGHTGQPGNILFVSPDPQEITLRVFNDRYPANRFALSSKTVDHRGQMTAKATEKLDVRQGEVLEKPLQILPACLPGYYVTTVELADGTGETFLRESIACGVVHPPTISGLDADSFFGLHTGVSREAMQRIGAKWLRNFRGWRWLERTRGDITLTAEDYARARQDGFHLLETVRFTLQPNWAKTDNPRNRDFDAFRTFLSTIVTRAGDTVTTWEIENEPDLVIPAYTGLDTEGAARFYANLVREAAAAIKAANPDARVMACGVSGGDCRRHFPFSKTTFGEVAHLIDGYPIHPYANARHIGPAGTSIGPEANNMRGILLNAKTLSDTHGGPRPIWIGELGWSLDVRTEPLSRHALNHARYLSRALIIARSVPGVERVMWFKAAGCVERKVYEYGLWRSEYNPLPAAVAYATVARRLHRAEPLDIIFNSDLRAYAFLSSDLPIIAIWRHRGDISRMMVNLHPDDVTLTGAFGRNYDPIVQEGRLVLPVSENPLYLSSERLDPKLLCERIRRADVDLEPVSISVLFSDIDTISGFVKNALPKPLSGTLTLSNAADGDRDLGSVDVDLDPSGVQSFSFDVGSGKDKTTHRAYRLSCVTAAGSVTKALTISAHECPKQSVSFSDTPNLSPLGNAEWTQLQERGDILPPDPGIGWDGPSDLSVKATWSWDDSAFYFTAIVRDDVHHQDISNSRAWKGDSIQLAFDAGNDAGEQQLAFDSDDDWEYTVALTPEGAAAFRTHGPEGSDIGTTAANVRTAVVREAATTTYQIAIPWSDLSPLSPVEGRMFGFNFMVNDNDGTGRNYWMGMTPGIGEMKYPYCYRKVVLSGR